MESSVRDDIVVRLGEGEDSPICIPCLFDSILILSISPAMSGGVDCDDIAAAGLVPTRLGDEVGESDMSSECSVFRFDDLWDVFHTYPFNGQVDGVSVSFRNSLTWTSYESFQSS
jgi:hypothetical protein